MWKNVHFFYHPSKQSEKAARHSLYEKKDGLERKKQRKKNKSMTLDFLCMYESISFRQTYMKYYLYYLHLSSSYFVLIATVAAYDIVVVVIVIDVSMHENINNRMNWNLYVNRALKVPFIDIIRFHLEQYQCYSTSLYSILQHEFL